MSEILSLIGIVWVLAGLIAEISLFCKRDISYQDPLGFFGSLIAYGFRGIFLGLFSLYIYYKYEAKKDDHSVSNPHDLSGPPADRLFYAGGGEINPEKLLGEKRIIFQTKGGKHSRVEPFWQREYTPCNCWGTFSDSIRPARTNSREDAMYPQQECCWGCNEIVNVTNCHIVWKEIS